MISSFEDLEVWQKAHQLTLEVYRFTRTFPIDEKYELIRQLRRAILSVETNIAEGTGRRTTRDLIYFLYNAIGSLQEVRSLCRVSVDLGYFEPNKHEEFKEKLMSVLMMLKKLIGNLETKISSHESRNTNHVTRVV